MRAIFLYGLLYGVYLWQCPEARAREVVVNGKEFIVSDTNSRIVIETPPVIQYIEKRVEVPVYQDSSYDLDDDLDDACSVPNKPVESVKQLDATLPTGVNVDAGMGDEWEVVSE